MGRRNELTVVVGVGQKSPRGSVGAAVVENIVARAVGCAVPAGRITFAHLHKHVDTHFFFFFLPDRYNLALIFKNRPCLTDLHAMNKQPLVTFLRTLTDTSGCLLYTSDAADDC